MFAKNLSKREKIIFGVCVFFAAFAIIYSLVIEPLALKWKGLNEDIESKTASLVKDMRLLRMFRTLEAEHSQYQEFIELSKSEEEEFAKTLSEIENVSKRSSCYIANVKPRSSRQVGNYREILFEVVAEGKIGELSRFIYETEASNQFLRVSRFTITSKAASDRLKATFIISKIIIL